MQELQDIFYSVVQETNFFFQRSGKKLRRRKLPRCHIESATERLKIGIFFEI